MLAALRKLVMPSPIPKPTVPPGCKRIETMVCIPCKKVVELRSEHVGHEVRFPFAQWEVIESVAASQEKMMKKLLEMKVKELTGKK